MLRTRVTAFVTAACFVLASCGGSGNGSTNGASNGTGGSGSQGTPITYNNGISYYTNPSAASLAAAADALTSADVNKILAQAVQEANARQTPSWISVVDRVGNVLAMYRMNGANDGLKVPPPPGGGPSFDLQGANVPGGAPAGAIAKAVTAAYLSSAGNAFTPRTASDIVQEHFPLTSQTNATTGLESGPLFGVQFSSLPCSDLNRRFGIDGSTGPKRSPLGLSGDPGGIPLYKNGLVVGGIGVMGDGIYGVDDDTTVSDVTQNDPTKNSFHDNEEFIALAGAQSFEAAAAIHADRVSIDGTLLSYSDATVDKLASNPASAPAAPGGGAFVAITGYYDPAHDYNTPRNAAGPAFPGTPFDDPASGYRPATAAERSAGSVIANVDAVVLVDQNGNNRYPIRKGTETPEQLAQPLTAAEVKAIAEEAFTILTRARGAIRQPEDSRMQATMSIVDTNGQVLAIHRAPDAPVFGTDVSLQKARTAAFFSNPKAAADLTGNTAADATNRADIAGFVQKLRTFLNDPNAFLGDYAYAERPIGLLSRPYFPDGQVGTANGPLSRPIASFSPFSTGMQSALILGNVLQHVGYILSGGATPDTPAQCTPLPAADAAGHNRLANGTQIFPGGVPIYRGSTLVGAIGVSGDGIDQDDMVSFLGTFNGGARVGTVGHAAQSMRISNLAIPAAKGGFLPYVQCPIASFLDTSDQNVCQGK